MHWATYLPSWNSVLHSDLHDGQMGNLHFVEIPLKSQLIVRLFTSTSRSSGRLLGQVFLAKRLIDWARCTLQLLSSCSYSHCLWSPLLSSFIAIIRSLQVQNLEILSHFSSLSFGLRGCCDHCHTLSLAVLQHRFLRFTVCSAYTFSEKECIWIKL